MIESVHLVPHPLSGNAHRASEPEHCGSPYDFVDRVALPCLIATPAQTRIDRRTGLDNRPVAGRAWFEEDEYGKVHASTHYNPIRLTCWHTRAHVEYSTVGETESASRVRLGQDRPTWRQETWMMIQCNPSCPERDLSDLLVLLAAQQ